MSMIGLMRASGENFDSSITDPNEEARKPEEITEIIDEQKPFAEQIELEAENLISEAVEADPSLEKKLEKLQDSNKIKKFQSQISSYDDKTPITIEFIDPSTASRPVFDAVNKILGAVLERVGTLADFMQNLESQIKIKFPEFMENYGGLLEVPIAIIAATASGAILIVTIILIAIDIDKNNKLRQKLK